MQPSSFSATPCPVSGGLEPVDEWWGILTIRDVTRLDAFLRNLGIARNIPSRHLRRLVAAGLLERRRYCQRLPRHDHVLTERGRDFRPVLWTMAAWGNKPFMSDGGAMARIDGTVVPASTNHKSRRHS